MLILALRLLIRSPPVDACEYFQASLQVPASNAPTLFPFASESSIHIAGIRSSRIRCSNCVSDHMTATKQQHLRPFTHCHYICRRKYLEQPRPAIFLHCFLSSSGGPIAPNSRPANSICGPGCSSLVWLMQTGWTAPGEHPALSTRRKL